MIDLAFVRANLPVVEEKLHTRGMDPAVVLGDFATIDRERREAITQVATSRLHPTDISLMPSPR